MCICERRHQSTTVWHSCNRPAFEYDKGGKVVKMSYHLAPDEIMEDREQAAIWERRALEAALRSRRTPRRS